MQPAHVKHEIAASASFSGFLIDPKARTISAHIYNGDWRSIAPALGPDVHSFDLARIEDQDGNSLVDVFVDDEGMVPEKGNAHFFTINGYLQPLAGRGLVLASDQDGNTIGARVSLEKLRANVMFLQYIGSGMFECEHPAHPGTILFVPIESLGSVVLPELIEPDSPDAMTSLFARPQGA